jgi:hypothetical protein
MFIMSMGKADQASMCPTAASVRVMVSLDMSDMARDYK